MSSPSAPSLFTYLGRTNPLPPPVPLPTPYVIGLCGGITSGKSSVSSHLGSLGAELIDCDKLAHKLYESTDSPLYQSLVEEFGSDIVTSDTRLINRKELGRIVFSQPEKLQKLNSLVWPAILQAVKRRIEEIRADPKGKRIVLVEAAILIESGWYQRVNGVFHEIWVISIPREEAIRRLSSRNGLSREDAIKRIESQMTNEARVEYADLILSTETPVELTKQNVEQAWKELHKRIGLDLESE